MWWAAVIPLDQADALGASGTAAWERQPTYQICFDVSEAETRKREAIIAAAGLQTFWEEFTTIEAAEARIADLRRDGIGTDPGENWIIESVSRQIGTLSNFDADMQVKQRIQEKKHTYYWACDFNEGWEEIPKYLFDALNRFEDERQKTEAEVRS
jgi:hypothetical protein